MKILSVPRLFCLLVALLLLAVPAWASEGQDVKDMIKRTFEVNPGGTMHVDLDYGNVDVQTRNGNTVVVEVVRQVDVSDRASAQRVLDNHHVSFQQNGDNISIESRYEEGGGFWGSHRQNKLKVHINVQVPKRYNVNFKSGAGNINVADLEGSVEGETGAGNVGIGDVRGSVNVSSGAGNMEIRGATGRVKVSSGAGNLTLYNIRGTVEASTGAGNIDAIITEQPNNDSRLESGAGNVTVSLADRIGIYVDAVASLGSASTDYPLEVEGKWMKRSFAGAVNGGGPEVYMRAGVGNVALKKQ